MLLLIVVLTVTAYFLTRRTRDLVDFEVMQRAGARVLTAEPLYRDDDGHFQFKYLPLYAFAMTPFAKTNLETSKFIWFSISVALLIAFVRRSVDALPDRHLPKKTLYWLIAVLLLKFVSTELMNGQCNVMLGVLAMAAYDAARRGRAATAGAWIAAAVFVKPYALVLLPSLALTFGAPAVLVFAGVMTAGLLVPVPVYGWHGNLALLAGWYHTVTATTAPNLLLRHAISFAAMWAKWAGPGPGASEFAIASVIVALAFAALVWRKRHLSADPAYLEVGFMLMLVPLLSPQGWDYVLLLGTPAMLILVDRWSQMTTTWRVVTAIGFVLANLTTFDTVGQHLYMVVTTYAVVSVGAIALLASLVSVRLRGLA